jgi:hypothetical protein
LTKNLRTSNDIRAAAMAASRTILIIAVVAVVVVAGIAAAILMGGSNNNDEPRIIVTAPTAGSSHAPGTNLIIHWTSKGNVGETVKIQVSHLGGTMATIVDEAPNNGTYIISIPTGTFSGRNDYYVRVTSNLNTSVYGESGQFTISWDMTPTVSYSYQETTKGNYTFIITGISRNDVPKTAVEIEVTPSVGEGHVGGWTGTGQNLAEDDNFTVGWMLPGAIYDVIVRYLPTMSAFINAHVLTSGTSLPQVGQFVNYTVAVIISNGTGTHEGQGYLRIVITSVNATTIIYNSTLSVTIDNVSSMQQIDLALNWSTGFGGFDVKYPPAGTYIYYAGDTDVSTPWGSLSCKGYESWMESERTGHYCMLDSVMLRGDKVTYKPGGDVAENITYQINDTNIASVTG